MMGGSDLLSRLHRGDRILLDGATGSELQRRGVDVSKGASKEGGNGAWSATAVEDAPEVIRAIHEDYLRIGAGIITANSYNTNRGILSLVGLGHKMEEFTRRAVEIARDARDRVAPDALVAGSIAGTTRFPGGWSAERVAPADQLHRDWGDQVAVLTKAGADVILIETMSSIFQLIPAVEEATQSGLPVLLGIFGTPAGTLHSGETMEELVRALDTKGRRVDAILIMCTAPEAVCATLPGLRAAFRGPIGAYANIGYVRGNQRVRYPESQYFVFDTAENTPERYAEYGREWLGMGAQIVGGCCGTTPDHIAALRPVVLA